MEDRRQLHLKSMGPGSRRKDGDWDQTQGVIGCPASTSLGQMTDDLMTDGHCLTRRLQPATR